MSQAMKPCNDALRLTNKHESELNSNFVRCIKTILNMLKAMHDELVPFNILREDKRQHILTIVDDIIEAIRQFQQLVDCETKRFSDSLYKIPSFRPNMHVHAYGDVRGFCHEIKLWQKILP